MDDAIERGAIALADFDQHAPEIWPVLNDEDKAHYREGARLVSEAMGEFDRGVRSVLERLTSDEAIRAACVADGHRLSWITADEAARAFWAENGSRLAAVAAALSSPIESETRDA